MAGVVGVNLKLYFGYAETVDWCTRVAEIASAHPAVATGNVRPFVLPSAPALAAASGILRPAGVQVGGQNLHSAGRGPFTGEVDAAMLAELGCELVAIGHAERRRLFGESDEDVALKVAAAVDHGLVPLVCIGEGKRTGAPAATAECVEQAERALSLLAVRDARIMIAYEPVWAIGAAEPAPAEHVAPLCIELRRHLRGELGFVDLSLIYGGTAGPGLWQDIRDSVDGLFLGRRAHDPAGFAGVLTEMQADAPAPAGAHAE